MTADVINKNIEKEFRSIISLLCNRNKRLKYNETSFSFLKRSQSIEKENVLAFTFLP